VSEEVRQAPVVNGTQVMAAGFAAATAAFVTSRFGVAGTLLGAAVTAMIITGGSAILKAYLEGVTGHVRKVPDRVRARRERRKAERYAEPETLPDRPDLRDNFAGRMRAALNWFSHLPPLSRRSILVKGLVAAVVAFLIGMVAVWGVERVINNSLSCGLWANCPDGAEPGIRLVDDGRGAGSTFSGGRAGTRVVPVNEVQDPAGRLNGVQQDGSFQQGNPDLGQPAPRDRDARPGGIFDPGRPAQQERPAQQDRPVEQETPSSASPAPARPAPGETPEEPELMPQDASPAPAQ
jgi:hypothetical protein